MTLSTTWQMLMLERATDNGGPFIRFGVFPPGTDFTLPPIQLVPAAVGVVRGSAQDADGVWLARAQTAAAALIQQMQVKTALDSRANAYSGPQPIPGF